MIDVALAAPVVWYGPRTVSFSLPFSGNPYDPAENDVRVEFRGPQGVVERRLAYYDDGVWKATLLARTKGSFRPTPTRNGQAQRNLPSVTLSRIQPRGFVRVAGKGFAYDDGAPYWPLGHNLAWASGPVTDLPAYLKTMGAEGLNWARIWTDHWDDKNPYWPTRAAKPKEGEMSPAVLRKWDAIVTAAEGAGVRFQMTMFHHGPWSTRVNSNWGENPWNVENGGWLKTPSEFFTDPKAGALSRAWLRYAVARWGHSPSVMAWELFNEVQWCDPHYEGGDAILGRWHDAMADYVRSIDPYHHLVATSSDLDLPIYRRMDFLQPHTYPPSVEAAVAAAPKTAKPLFFGEFGPGQLNGGRSTQVAAIRDGIYTALLTGQSGAGQFWTWDLIPTQKLETEFVRAARLVRASGVIGGKGFVPREVALGAGVGADTVAVPGMGWGKSTRFAFRLPQDAARLGQLSSFLQGKAHPEMQPQPVAFTFTLPKSATVTVEVVGASDAGGAILIDLDGTNRTRREVPKGGRATLTIDVSAGAHTLVLRNDGPDWVQVGRVTIPGIAPRATARALSNGSRAALRIKGEKGLSVSLDGLGLKDGRYVATLSDLDAGDTTVPVAVQGGKAGRIALPGTDVFVVVKEGYRSSGIVSRSSNSSQVSRRPTCANEPSGRTSTLAGRRKRL